MIVNKLKNICIYAVSLILMIIIFNLDTIKYQREVPSTLEPSESEQVSNNVTYQL